MKQIPTAKAAGQEDGMTPPERQTSLNREGQAGQVEEIYPLSELKPGEQGVIARIEGAALLRLRLMERGLLPGERVQTLKIAPLGDPIELALDRCRLSIRKKEAQNIFIMRMDES